MSPRAPLLLALAVAALLASAHAQPEGYCTLLGASGSLTGEPGENQFTVLDNLSSVGFTEVNKCAAGYKCNSRESSRCTRMEKGCRRSGGLWICEKTCEESNQVPCVDEGSINGDPHLLGFDDSRFDFHGRAEGYFALFGRDGGDMLVAKMREYRKMFTMSDGTQLSGTLFKEFGLQVAGTDDKMRVYMHRLSDDEEKGAWALRVDANGWDVKGELAAHAVTVKFENNKKVLVDTAEHAYSFLLVHGADEVEGHLNLQVALKTRPAANARYLGVLGTTLNRRLGLAVDEAMHPSAKDVVREAAFVKAFEMDSLFPAYRKRSVDLSGIVARMLVRKPVAAQDSSAFVASSRSYDD